MALHLRKAGTRIDDEEMGLEEPERASSDSSSSSNNSSRRWPRHGSASNAGKGLLREPPLLCVRIVWLLGLAFCCWMFTLPHWQLDDEPTPTTPVPASSSSTVLGTAAGQQQQQHLEQQQHLAMQHEREDSLRDTAQQHLAHKEAKAKAKAKAMAPRVRVPITHGLARGGTPHSPRSLPLGAEADSRVDVAPQRRSPISMAGSSAMA